MRVFLTGATGFIGSHIVPELLGAGHTVLGLTRSDEGGRQLEAAGAEAYRGDLEDPDELARGAENVDAVVHTAFDHEMTRFVANTEKDGRVIEAIGTVLARSDRPFLITSGVGMGAERPGSIAMEEILDRDNPNPRRLSELTGEKLAGQGVSVAAMRLPQVHDRVKQGLVTYLVQLAREKGVSAYVGDGANRWAAAPVADVARLYRLALEHHRAGARWHAVAEEGVSLRAIAEVIGAGLGVPVRSLSLDAASAHFGWLEHFAAMDIAASSTLTRKRLDWSPSGPGLIEDLQDMNYDAVRASLPHGDSKQ